MIEVKEIESRFKELNRLELKPYIPRGDDDTRAKRRERGEQFRLEREKKVREEASRIPQAEGEFSEVINWWRAEPVIFIKEILGLGIINSNHGKLECPVSLHRF